MRRPRSRGALAASIVAATTLCLAPAAVAAPHAPSRTGDARATTCATVAISRFAFHPRQVAERATTRLVEAVRNCSGATFKGTLQTSGRLVCVVVDPLDVTVRVTAGSTWHHAESFVAPPCAGNGTIDGRLTASDGSAVAARTATVVVTAS